MESHVADYVDVYRFENAINKVSLLVTYIIYNTQNKGNFWSSYLDIILKQKGKSLHILSFFRTLSKTYE